jgi:hypothetical protein
MRIRRPVIVIDDTGIGSGELKCQGCKGVAKRVDDEIALQLRGEDEWLLPPAFECPRCQAVIFVDELDDGKFIPPQFRKRRVATMKQTLECPHLGGGTVDSSA